MTSTPVGMRCPECAPGPSRVQKAASSVSPDTPVVTYVIGAVCVALELGILFGGGEVRGGGRETTPLFQDFGLKTVGVADGEVWRLVTNGFLHYGVTHLMFNMLGLYILGSMLEPTIGRVRFTLVYFVSVLVGSFGAALLQGPEVVLAGASGGVFGLMGAAILIMRHRGIDPMASGLPLWLGLNLIITFTYADISIGGHIGGLVGGALAALVMFELPDRVRTLPRQAPTLLAAAIGVLAIAGSLAVA